MGDFTIEVVLSQWDLVLRLLVATFLGALIGLERERLHKPAGLRTYILVSLGSALFTILSYAGFSRFSDSAIDVTRIAAQVLTGIGFIGAGVIIHRNGQTEGITTAAGLWTTAAIGMASALGLYVLAATTTAIALITFLLLGLVTGKFESKKK